MEWAWFDLHPNAKNKTFSDFANFCDKLVLDHPVYELLGFNCQNFAREVLVYLLGKEKLQENGKWLVELEDEQKLRALGWKFKELGGRIIKDSVKNEVT